MPFAPSELVELIGKSGFVGPPLAAGALAMGYALGYRAMLLYRGDRRPVRALLADAERGTLRPVGVLAAAACEARALVGSRDLGRRLDEVLFPHRRDLARFAAVARSVVRVAPLLGLLGTVAGMIETFDQLAAPSAGDAGAGVAGGISEALFSTQLGLVVAVPGLLLGRLLEVRAARLDDQLTQLRDVLDAEHGGGGR